MAVRKIRVLGDEILRKACKPVPEMTPRNAQLIEDMFDTMYENNGVGLAASQVLEKQPGVELRCVSDYSGIGKIQYIAGSMGLTETGSDYTDVAALCYMVPEEQEREFRSRLTEATAGRVQPEELRRVSFAVCQGELLIL